MLAGRLGLIGVSVVTLAVAVWQGGSVAAGSTVQGAQAPASQSASALPQAAPSGVLAGDVYNNLKVLQGLPAELLIPTMLQVRAGLGVECTYCHTPHNWPSDGTPNKLKARTHLQMVGFIKQESFDGKAMVSCWTCHRGHATPETLPPDPEATQRVAGMINLAAADQDKPAENVFMNIQTLKGVPAGRVPAIMAIFSRSLGVRCNFCHVPENFASDDKDNKKMARKMLGMVRGTLQKFYNGSGPVACFTCHHGSETPEISAGKSAD